MFDYNAFDSHTVIRSDNAIPAGRSTLSAHFLRGPKRTASVTLSVDGEVIGRGDIPWMMSTISSVGMSIAMDAGSAVSTEYAAPFAFEGELQTMEFQLLTRQDAEARKAELAAEMSRQ